MYKCQECGNTKAFIVRRKQAKLGGMFAEVDNKENKDELASAETHEPAKCYKCGSEQIKEVADERKTEIKIA